ncbi:MAG: hypothetical protein NXY57DRAFT_1050946 [Lentinula lateritia]|nr:MAG: hypothetical protein NXY57DRAFT_1050946 [Lentinula lateritia]
MIACCRTKSYIIHLKEEGMASGPTLQHALRGNVIIYPQRPSAISKILPPDLDDIASAICAWLDSKAKPLSVRPAVVRAALVWLKSHNVLYKDIEINNALLDSLPANYTLPVRVEHVDSANIDDSITSGYDTAIHSSNQTASSVDSASQLSFESVIITDVDGCSSANDLRAAALQHIKTKGGSYVEIPHDPLPVNEFMNPSLFPMIYPSLYPYGIGGFEDYDRPVCVSMKRHTLPRTSFFHFHGIQYSSMSRNVTARLPQIK